MLLAGGCFFAQPSRPLAVEGGMPPQEKGPGQLCPTPGLQGARSPGRWRKRALGGVRRRQNRRYRQARRREGRRMVSASRAGTS